MSPQDPRNLQKSFPSTPSARPDSTPNLGRDSVPSQPAGRPIDVQTSPTPTAPQPTPTVTQVPAAFLAALKGTD